LFCRHSSAEKLADDVVTAGKITGRYPPASGHLQFKDAQYAATRTHFNTIIRYRYNPTGGQQAL
jgi:hypothetical protein